MTKKKVAVVHDWFFSRRGGERVLEEILNCYQTADVFCLFGDVSVLDPIIAKRHAFYFSALNVLPGIKNFYKILLPLFPFFIEQFRFDEYDLVISSSACVAKGVIVPPHAVSICYIHSPMRYAWDLEAVYFPKKQWWKRPLAFIRGFLLSYLRMWDVTSAARVDCFIANSHFVKRRCALYYGNRAPDRLTVIAPPVHLVTQPVCFVPRKEKAVLLFGAWVPYKRFFYALELLVKNGISVIAAGHGEEFNTAYSLYKNHPLVTFEGPIPDEKSLIHLYQRAKVLLFPAVEDFGIIAVEALHCGTPVVAPRRGGSLDILESSFEDGGLFTPDDDTELIHVVSHFLDKEITEESHNHRQESMRRFSPAVFREQFLETVNNTFNLIRP